MLALIPPQCRLPIAGLAVAALMALSAYGAWQWQANAYTAQIANMQADQARSLAAAQAKARGEEQRRKTALEIIRNESHQSTEQALADAAAAGSALERLQLRIAAAEQRSRAAGNTITVQLSQAAEADSRVRTELLGRLGALAKLYAGAADESRIAGLTCERSFDSLGGG